MRVRSGPDRADEVFNLLLQEGDCPPPQAAEKLGMTSRQFQEALRYLATMGLVRPAGVGALPVPVSPETAFALLLDTAEQTAADRLVGLRSLRAAFGALADSLPAFQSSGAPQHARVEVLVGQRRIAESLDAMAATARREILALRPNDLAAPERWGEAARRSGQVLARGVSLRTIHLHSTPENPSGHAHLCGLRRAGARVRLAMTLPFRLTLVDDVQALVTLSPDSDEMTALEIHGAALCELLRQVFEHCWVYGERLAGPDPGPGPGSDSGPGSDAGPGPAPGPGSGLPERHVHEVELTERERMVLRMFAAGLKDGAIARNLGVSDRTLRRTIAPLLTKLGADSRFQAGMKAVERGLLSRVELGAAVA
ncbi:helix-turn-helix transcriptional regulator [Streptomyces caniferus]|uniref:helix-turn-helix transcriptional regulator n=1 Tax=Streptomyces caniferus TaxID=285557 RepID=UPI00380D536E